MNTKPAGSAATAQDPSMEEILASIRRILSEDETSSAAADPAAHAASADHGHGGGAIMAEADALADDILDLDPGMLVMPQMPPPAPEPTPHPATESTPHTATEPAPHAATAPAPHAATEVAQAAAAEPMQIHSDPPQAAAPPQAFPLAAAAAPDPFDDLPEPEPPAPAPVAALAAEIAPSHDATDAMEPDLNAQFDEPPAVDHPAAPVPHLVAPAAAAAAAESLGSLVRTLAAERATAVHRGGPTIEDLVREEIRPLLKDWLDTHLPPIVERLVRAEIERVVSRTQP